MRGEEDQPAGGSSVLQAHRRQPSPCAGLRTEGPTQPVFRQPPAKGPEAWPRAPLLHMLFVIRTLYTLKGC